MVASMPNPPYIALNATGYTADGSTEYKITGYLAELLDNLGVSYAL